MSKARDYSEEATRFSRPWWLDVGRGLLRQIMRDANLSREDLA